MSVLALQGVSHAYGGVAVLHGVSLEVGPGEVVCLLGPSGCGKTTTLRIIAGLEALQEGRVFIEGREVAGPDVAPVAPEERRVGLVFQDYALFPHLNVIGNVIFGLKHLPAGDRRKRALAVLEQVGMAGFPQSYPHMLSGGQQQRVALARALAPKPSVMLLDEPFSDLDYRLKAEIRDETLRVLKASRTPTLLVTHDGDEAMFMADRIALMHTGRIVQQGPPVELYGRPADGFVARFFGNPNVLEGVVRDGAVTTPLGAVSADGCAEGTRVEVLVRQEALHLVNSREGADVPSVGAVVAATHVLGPNSLLDLRLDAYNKLLRARIPGSQAPAVGETVRVTLDREQTFVFPAKGGE